MFDFMTNTKHFGNTILDYTIAFVAFLAVILVITVIRQVVIAKIHNWAKGGNRGSLPDIIHSLKMRLLPVTYLLAFYVAIELLKVPDFISKYLDKVTVVFVSVFVILFINDTMGNVAKSFRRNGRSAMPPGVVTIAKFLVWIFGILFIFANLGYNVSTFITGLGIGGVAIALASQAILGDLFNYFVILFDKPFEKGDTIQIDDKTGVVEYIGIKSTRIRSSTGELLLISNTDLTKSRIHNFKAMDKRRCLAVLGVEYGTPEAKLKALPDMIRGVVSAVPGVEFARVHFSQFGASSLNFELAYFVLSNDYSDYVKAVQAVNYGLVEEFGKAGINFAFPTQTLHVKKD